MQVKKLAKFIAVAVSIFALAACTHMKKNTDPNEGSSYDDPYTKAQTSGAGSSTRYNDMASAKHGSKDVFYFDFDKSVVKQQDLPALYAKADYLIAHPKAKIILEGHTDPRGSREYNVGLGERRATAIADVLKSRGVNPSQIRMLSYGAERLASQGHSEDDYQLDRRAIFAHIQQG